MLLDIVILIVGLALILYGANFLTDGSAALAQRFNISEFVIGLTIVAIGTSMPEFVTAMWPSETSSVPIFSIHWPF